MFSVSFFCVMSGSPDIRACRADSESVRETAFLGSSSHEMIVSVAFSSARTSALQFEHSIPQGAETVNRGLPGRLM